MTQTPVTKSQGHVGSLIVSAMFVLAGVVTLYDTTHYADRDSQVFPKTVAIILIITASASFIMRFLKPTENGGFGEGIWWRRVLLVVGMLLTCLAMPYVGFLAAGAITFVAGLIAAMHDKWSAKAAILYVGCGAVIMVTFFALFKYVLYVPLP